MIKSFNKVVLVGTVGRDPEVHEMKDGSKVAHFSVATHRRPTEDKGERTDWHRITVRGAKVQFCEDYVTVGRSVYVEGTLEYDAYERDGITIPTAEIIVREIAILT